MQNCPASQQLISILRPCSVTVLGQLSSFLWATKLPNQSSAHRCQPSSWVLDEVHTASQNVRMLERKKRNSESADAPSFLPQTSSVQTGGRPCPSPAQKFSSWRQRHSIKTSVIEERDCLLVFTKKKKHYLSWDPIQASASWINQPFKNLFRIKIQLQSWIKNVRERKIVHSL